MINIGSTGKSASWEQLAAKEQPGDAQHEAMRVRQAAQESELKDAARGHPGQVKAPLNAGHTQNGRPSGPKKSETPGKTNHTVGLSVGRAPAAPSLSVSLQNPGHQVLRLRGGASDRGEGSSDKRKSTKRSHDDLSDPLNTRELYDDQPIAKRTRSHSVSSGTSRNSHASESSAQSAQLREAGLPVHGSKVHDYLKQTKKSDTSEIHEYLKANSEASGSANDTLLKNRKLADFEPGFVFFVKRKTSPEHHTASLSTCSLSCPMGSKYSRKCLGIIRKDSKAKLISIKSFARTMS